MRKLSSDYKIEKGKGDTFLVFGTMKSLSRVYVSPWKVLFHQLSYQGHLFFHTVNAIFFLKFTKALILFHRTFFLFRQSNPMHVMAATLKQVLLLSSFSSFFRINLLKCV